MHDYLKKTFQFNVTMKVPCLENSNASNVQIKLSQISVLAPDELHQDLFFSNWLYLCSFMIYFYMQPKSQCEADFAGEALEMVVLQKENCAV